MAHGTHAEPLRANPRTAKSHGPASGALAVRVRTVEADRPEVRYSLSTTDSAQRSGSSRIQRAGTGTAGQAAPTCIQADRQRTGLGARDCRARKTCAAPQICRSNDMSVFFLRGIASALIAYATRALPSTRATWGAAMENELEHIESDLEALRWAAGCIAAAYLQRSAERSFGAILKKPSDFLP